VQPKQGFFHCRVNYRLLLAVTFGIPLPSLHVVSPPLARAVRCFTFRQRPVAETFNNQKEKRQPKLPRDHPALRDVGKMQTKLPLNGTIQHPDLAEALRGENGTFFCQQGGQGYIVTAAEGFSIKSLRPVGRKIVEANVVLQATPEPWAITKISEDVLEFGAVPQPSRQQRAA
jgi:hypothetical protein